MLKALKFAPLLKYLPLRADEITIDVLRHMATAAGIDSGLATPENLAGVQALMRAKHIDTVADFVAEPAMFEHVKRVLGEQFAARDDSTNMIVCPHCAGVITP